MIPDAGDVSLYKTEKKIVPAFGGEEGQHRVKDITDQVKIVASKVSPGNLIAQGKQFLSSKSTKEQGFYAIAALCFLVALILFIALSAVFGPAAVPLAFGVSLAPMGLGVVSLGLARAETKFRKEWEMPNPARLKELDPSSQQGKALKGELEELWLKRNQEKQAMQGKKEELKQAERELTRGKWAKWSSEEMQKKEEQVALIKSDYEGAILAYEQASLAFWKKGDPLEVMWIQRNLARKPVMALQGELLSLKRKIKTVQPGSEWDTHFKTEIERKNGELEQALQAFEEAELAYWQNADPQKADKWYEKIQNDRAERAKKRTEFPS